GWFPLGPRDVYVPWFHASRNYFTNVNVTNIRNVYVNKTVINNYYGNYRAGRVPPRGGHDYAYRNLPGAVTAVPRNVFTGARPVHPAVLKLNRTQLARTEVAVRPAVTPDRSSLGLRHATARPAAIKGREPFARPVVARHQPPPRPVDFAARQKVIASQHGQPLTPSQMHNLQKAQPAPRENRVKLVAAAGAAAAGAAAGAAHRGTPPRPPEPGARTQPTRSVVAPRPGEPPARRPSPTEPFKNTVHPIPARNQPVQPTRPGELPSARFAHPNQQPATLPRAPVIRPAGEPQRNAPTSERLPVVRPVERAPQQVDNRAAQQQRQAQAEAQQRAGEQQAQQQRQAQVQAQQRARDQQAQQQRQMQEQQRARDQQAQQERIREQQMQQQRQAQEQRVQQQRAMQMQQQREMQMRQQQVQQRQMQRAPQPRNNPPPQRRE